MNKKYILLTLISLCLISSVMAFNFNLIGKENTQTESLLFSVNHAGTNGTGTFLYKTQYKTLDLVFKDKYCSQMYVEGATDVWMRCDANAVMLIRLQKMFKIEQSKITYIYNIPDNKVLISTSYGYYTMDVKKI